MEINNFGAPVILYGDVVKQDLDDPFEKLPSFSISCFRVSILADRPQF